MKKLCTLLLGLTFVFPTFAGNRVITVNVGHPTGKVSPRLYGLMTEEINHSYDGGLYAELIQNRSFMDDPARPVHWSLINNNGAVATISLDSENAFNDKLTRSLRLTITQAGNNQLAGVANNGYWGIPVMPKTLYRASLLAKAGSGFSGPGTISLVSDDDENVIYASEEFSGLGTEWKKFEATLKTGNLSPTARAHLAITFQLPGTVWFALVSLFPPTWNNRPNGFRKDLMQLLVDMNPKFLRFPGGNYVEGDTIETRFDWKKTIGPLEERPGHQCPWSYRSSDGMGLLEFLEWCEDMKAEPVLAVYAGYSLKGIHVNPGPDLEPFVREALEEIEYVTGDASTSWGARRVKDGHPAPFNLNYVEIGNEDWFDKSGSYDQRFAQFSDAIKAKYSRLKLISTIGNDQAESHRVHSRKPDMTDEHYYRAADEFIRTSSDYAKDYDRNGPEIFVGEWAAHEDARIKPWDPGARQQPPTPSMKAALGDAVFMAAMERNSDLIKMQCYAPLFVNVNPGARQWRPDLVGYDALSAYGSPSYYAIQMFSRNLGDEILTTEGCDNSIQGAATRDGRTGEVFLKLVNTTALEQPVNIALKGLAALDSKGSAIVLAGNPEDTNSISHPRNVIPTTMALQHLKPSFSYNLPPHSVVVLKLKART
jgi:alpha-N-arabinofuranosidase